MMIMMMMMIVMMMMMMIFDDDDDDDNDDANLMGARDRTVIDRQLPIMPTIPTTTWGQQG